MVNSQSKWNSGGAPYRVARGLLMIGGLIVTLVLVSMISSHTSKPFASSEVQFTDSSSSGLQIVPASCPSDPHSLGECSPPPPPPPPEPPIPPVEPPPDGCPIGYVRQGGQCIFVACPGGYVLQNGQCVYQECPLGYTLQGGQCVFTGCPAGYVLQGGQCVAQCFAQCSGSNLVNSCTGSVIQSCAFGCSGGGCNGPPSPSILIWNVRPVLVREGDVALVSWSTQNVQSCTVRGTNGDGSGSNATGLWNTPAGDTQSTPITGQTIYTIICQGFAGSSPASVTRSTTVNVVPTFNEPPPQ